MLPCIAHVTALFKRKVSISPAFDVPPSSEIPDGVSGAAEVVTFYPKNGWFFRLPRIRPGRVQNVNLYVSLLRTGWVSAIVGIGLPRRQAGRWIDRFGWQNWIDYSGKCIPMDPIAQRAYLCVPNCKITIICSTVPGHAGLNEERKRGFAMHFSTPTIGVDANNFKRSWTDDLPELAH